MNYLGVYHSDYPRSARGVCDAPCISKGTMMLCSANAVSENRLMAMVSGRMRNRRELAAELGVNGNPADGNLIIAAYRRWGAGYPAHIEGPVITCVMDCERDMMVLSRDRMGEQPLFYTTGGEGKVVFSDHPDTLLKTSAAEPVVDGTGLCELFGLGPARTPGRTPLRDILSLEPGCALMAEGEKCTVLRYFEIRTETHREDVEETILHTRELLEQAVKPLHPLNPGLMLSGGLDSTALLALLSGRRTIETFSIDYREDSADFRPSAFRPERDEPYVEMAVKAFKTTHHRFMLEQAALAEALDQAVAARGFPGMADIDSSLLLFSREIRKHTRIVVSGECGDEVFGGYPWFRNQSNAEKGFPWSGSISLRERILRPHVRSALNLRGYIENAYTSAVKQAAIDGPADDHELNLKRMQMLCFRFFMPNLQERAAQMCGRYDIEVLTPLCDERLVQYVFNVPWKMKFMNGQEKGLFRAAVRDIMPEALNARKKSPYPKTSSPIYTEIIRGLTMAMLADREAPILRWIDEDAVRSIAESSLDPTETPWYGQLMAGPQMLAYIWQINTWMRERNITAEL